VPIGGILGDQQAALFGQACPPVLALSVGGTLGFLTAHSLASARALLCRVMHLPPEACEAARVAVRIVPFWGNAVSGFVAGAGTYAIGRAAIAYFVDDSPIQETRRIFLSMLPKGRSATKLP
jgi:hypothetical protein